MSLKILLNNTFNSFLKVNVQWKNLPILIKNWKMYKKVFEFLILFIIGNLTANIIQSHGVNQNFLSLTILTVYIYFFKKNKKGCTNWSQKWKEDKDRTSD